MIVRSIIELCPLELRKVGEEPLFAQESPRVERKSSSSLPLSLQTRFPQRVWWELVSDPMIRGRLLSLAYLAKGVVSSGGAGPVMSMYEDARISSVVLSLILMAIWPAYCQA